MNDSDLRTDEVVRVLLVSNHDWFTSALQAVLEPEGFVFARVRSARHALRHVEQSMPDIVILSDRLPDLDAAGLVRGLRAGGLDDSVPLLVHSPNFWHEAEQGRAVAAGAWDVIREPLRSDLVVDRLRRLLAIGRLVRASNGKLRAETDVERLPKLAALTRSIRRVEATAQRNAVPVSCVVVGPSRPAAGRGLERQRMAAASLCSTNLRVSDLCGWVADADFGIVAYNTTAQGILSMVRRLNELLDIAEDGVPLRPLSAGVIELSSEDGDGAEGGPDRPGPTANIASLSRLAAAQQALREARASGGGIRIAHSA